MEPCEKLKYFRTATTRPLLRAYENSAGIDICTPNEEIFKPNELKIINTRIIIKLPKNSVGFLISRSSVSKLGIATLNGVIDECYREEIKAICVNLTAEKFTLMEGT